jgi:protoheme ferro-lyase
VLVPVSLVADDLETLWEMDVAQRDLARSLGIPEVERAAALNDSAELASALAAVVARTLASGREPTL